MVLNTKQLEELESFTDTASEFDEEQGETEVMDEGVESALAWRRGTIEKALANVKKAAKKHPEKGASFTQGTLVFDKEQKRFGRIVHTPESKLQLAYIGNPIAAGKPAKSAKGAKAAKPAKLVAPAKAKTVSKPKAKIEAKAPATKVEVKKPVIAKAPAKKAPVKKAAAPVKKAVKPAVKKATAKPAAKKKPAPKKAITLKTITKTKTKKPLKAVKVSKPVKKAPAKPAAKTKKPIMKSAVTKKAPRKKADPVADPNAYIKLNFSSMSNKQLAEVTGLSEHTIRRKLGEWRLKRQK